MELLRAALVLVAVVGTIIFNGIAAAGLVNGVTPAEVSAAYPTVVTPAGYAFSIWSLIYFGLICFSIYQLLPNKRPRFSAVRSLVILSCLLNCAWVYFWHHRQIVICFVLIAALAAILALIKRRLPEPTGWPDSAAAAPFSIYLGWVSAATVVSFAILLSHLGYDVGPSQGAFGAALLVLATGLALFYRFGLRDHLAPLAIAWALTAIAVKQSGNTPVVSAAAVGVVACLIASLSFVVNLQGSQNE
ncbi:MAG: tryptophan-rich sensory protein [Chloracidobacterium sp.]|nr:tryptophan-rich sensory protein [Chloracidobacterium sp.]